MLLLSSSNSTGYVYIVFVDMFMCVSLSSRTDTYLFEEVEHESTASKWKEERSKKNKKSDRMIITKLTYGWDVVVMWADLAHKQPPYNSNL